MVAQILFAGNEQEIFNLTTPPGVTASSLEFDSNFSRLACDIHGGPFNIGPPALGNLPSVGTRRRLGSAFTPTFGFTTNIVEFRNSANQGVLRLLQDTNRGWQLQYWSGSTWTAIGAVVLPTGTMANAFVDVYCKIHGSLGEMSWWLGGTLQATLTGNTNFFSSSIDSVWVNGTQSVVTDYSSEFIIADSPTLAMRCATLGVTGAGTTNTFTSGTFADIDDTTVNDADFMTSATVNQVATFAASNLSSPAALLTPLAYVVPMRVRIGVSGPSNAQAALRSGSTNYFSSNVSPAPITNFSGDRFGVWNLDPDTGIPWTVSGINAAEPGVKSIT